MDLLILGGMSPRNQEWIRHVQKALAPMFDKTVLHDYAHWAAAATHMDMEHELNVLQSKVRKLDNYVIFAKSAGAVLSLKGITSKMLRPKACLFVGTPLDFARQHGHEIDSWLKRLDMPVTFAQNSHDPTGSYHELERFLRGHLHSPHYQTIELPGNTHDYNDMDKLNELMYRLLDAKVGA